MAVLVNKEETRTRGAHPVARKYAGVLARGLRPRARGGLQTRREPGRTPEERQEIIAAVQMALGPFKEEIRDELIEPLRAEMRQADNAILAALAQLRQDLPSIILDTMEPFVTAIMQDFRRVEERLDRLEKRLDRLEARVEGLDRKFMHLADEVTELKARVGRIEEALTAYGVKVVRTPEERWATRQDLQRVEQRVTQLEAIVYARFGGEPAPLVEGI